MWTSSLTGDEAGAVDDLAARAAAVDGADPLNEAARLSRTDGSGRHLLAWADGELAGYLLHSPEYLTAQIVVDPARRRRGIGTSLVTTLAASAPVRLWAFGDTPAAQGFAASLRLVPGRGLLIMEKELDAGPGLRDSSLVPRLDLSHRPSTPIPEVRAAEPHPLPIPEVRAAEPHTLPIPEVRAAARSLEGADGVVLRGFGPQDAEQLLAVNAAAFAHHAEQGSLDLDGLRARMAEEWFDPRGLILAVEGDTLLGFHWTKRHDAETGEVYVLGVAPQAQGRGIGRLLLNAGLDHLREEGCTRVILYVDSADKVAVQLYESTGFRVAHRDVLYVPKQEQS